MSQHLYKVGQHVQASVASLALTGRSAYRIVALLPPLGRINQYRVRHADETHDRIMTEPQLEPIAEPVGELVDAEASSAPAGLQSGEASPWARARTMAVGNPRNLKKRRH